MVVLGVVEVEGVFDLLVGLDDGFEEVGLLGGEESVADYLEGFEGPFLDLYDLEVDEFGVVVEELFMGLFGEAEAVVEDGVEILPHSLDEF